MEMRQEKVSDYRFASFGERAGKWASQSLHMYMHMRICIIIRAVNRALVIAAFSLPAKFFAEYVGMITQPYAFVKRGK